MKSSKKIKRNHIRLYDEICGRVDVAPISELLPAALRLARILDDGELARWVRLELDGYVRGNPAMGDDITVPEYRTVTGQYYDDYGNRLVLEDPELGFVFEDRLRFGVSELERLSSRRDEIRVQRTGGIDMVRKHLGVEVTTFGFPVSSVVGVLGSIRGQLVDRLASLEDRIAEARDALPVEVSSDPSGSLGRWVRDHLWHIAMSLGVGLAVAYLSYVFGWR